MRRTHQIAHLVTIGLALMGASSVAADEDAAAKRGKEIAENADRSVRGFGDLRAELKMVLSDRRGQETERLLELTSLEDKGGTEKSVVYFKSPRDIRGTALLTHTREKGDDDQWLYLPVLRRAKRIASANRASPFMGSEFSYEDLGATRVEDFSYLYIGDETLRKTDCYVIERTPTYKKSGYSKQRLWLDKKEYRVLQVVYWDQRKRKLKTLAFGKYSQYEGKFWKPGLAKMVNHRTKASTTLLWTNYQFDVGLKSSEFETSALRRVR